MTNRFGMTLSTLRVVCEWSDQSFWIKLEMTTGICFQWSSRGRSLAMKTKESEWFRKNHSDSFLIAFKVGLRPYLTRVSISRGLREQLPGLVCHREHVSVILLQFGMQYLGLLLKHFLCSLYFIHLEPLQGWVNIVLDLLEHDQALDQVYIKLVFAIKNICYLLLLFYLFIHIAECLQDSP